MRPNRFALLAAMVLLAGCASSAPASPPAGEGAAWSVTDTAGATWSNASLEGRPALLFFMATWCGTCAATAPKLSELHASYGDRVRFLSLGFDPSETNADLDAWAASKAQPWPHALDPARDAQREYGVKVQSTVVVLDAQGAVVWKSGYGPKADEARAALDEALSA